MIKIKIEGDENVVRGLRAMVAEIPEATRVMLDRAATETKGKMMDEAPEATGFLKRSMEKIGKPDQFTRIIGPDAEYGRYKTQRHYLPQRTPPLSRIQRWAEIVGATSTPYGGGAKQAAFLIARKIARSGYPRNPFVLRTYAWVLGQIEKHISPFVNRITARYSEG